MLLCILKALTHRRIWPPVGVAYLLSNVFEKPFIMYRHMKDASQLHEWGGNLWKIHEL